ncbi:MAG: putative periplasmic or secreted lipoprotein [Chloroflexi bacterium]|nr:putative periplasmic or secreted lipoprotein [Chloroflexota bacterium]
MSERLPRITAAQLLRALNRAGWRRTGQVGSHQTLRNKDNPGKVVVPVHAGEILALKTLQRILDQANLTATELRKLL